MFLPREFVLSEIVYDYLIICAEGRNEDDILSEALHLGIDRDVILPLRIFRIPFFDFDRYIQIKKSNISILSDYCFAGFLYHKFGLKHCKHSNMST